MTSKTAPAASILIVEDENDIRDLLRVQLETVGNQVTAAVDGEEAIRMIESNPKGFDLFLIDRMLPGIGGIELCQRLKQNRVTVTKPIIMVTALTQSENIIEGLDAGADDYITKPFDMNVLQARVRAHLRKVDKFKNDDKMVFNSFMIEPSKCRVSYKNDDIALTSTEYKILSIMAKKPGHVFTRKQLIGQIQGDNIFVTNRTVDTHIAGLRKKLGEASKFIETIRGIGYRFKDDA